MNIEELKLVLETLQHTTDGAKDFGVWWIALHYGVKAFDALMIAAAVWGVAWAIVKAIVLCNGSDTSERRLQHLRDLMRIGSPGLVSNSEFDQMRDKIRDWMKEGGK